VNVPLVVLTLECGQRSGPDLTVERESSFWETANESSSIIIILCKLWRKNEGQDKIAEHAVMAVILVLVVATFPWGKQS
jgi:hypothetical protein